MVLLMLLRGLLSSMASKRHGSVARCGGRCDRLSGCHIGASPRACPCASRLDMQWTPLMALSPSGARSFIPIFSVTWPHSRTQTAKKKWTMSGISRSRLRTTTPHHVPAPVRTTPHGNISDIRFLNGPANSTVVACCSLSGPCPDLYRYYPLLLMLSASCFPLLSLVYLQATSQTWRTLSDVSSAMVGALGSALPRRAALSTVSSAIAHRHRLYELQRYHHLAGARKPLSKDLNPLSLRRAVDRATPPSPCWGLGWDFWPALLLDGHSAPVIDSRRRPNPSTPPLRKWNKQLLKSSEPWERTASRPTARFSLRMATLNGRQSTQTGSQSLSFSPAQQKRSRFSLRYVTNTTFP